MILMLQAMLALLFQLLNAMYACMLNAMYACSIPLCVECVQLQWKDELVLVKDGKVVHVVSREGSRGLLPEIHSMTPVCVSSTQMEAVKITGANIAGPGQVVLCRSRGTSTSAATTTHLRHGPSCRSLPCTLWLMCLMACHVHAHC